MPRPLRLLTLTKGLGMGGVERLIASSANLMDPERVQQEVAYVLPHKWALVRDLESGNVPVYCLGREGAHHYGWPLRLRKLVEEHEYDLIHTHMPLSSVAARLVLPAGVPIIHTEHNMWDRHHVMTRTANRLTVRKLSSVVAVSQAVSDSMHLGPRILSGGLQKRVVLHGPDLRLVRSGPEARAQARERLGIRPEALVIGTVGNLTPKKNQSMLMDAHQALVEEGMDVELVIIGSGPLESELSHYARGLSSSDRIHMLGLRTDVADLLPGLDVFCLSSKFEGLSIALLEAMASNVACVSTPAGGVIEVIEHRRSGWLTESHDLRHLLEGLRAVLGRPALRDQLAAGGRERATAFSLESAVREWESIYEQVVASA